MDNAFSRTAMLIGAEGVALLAAKRVAVFGLGGVGGAACEALARAGVGALALFDDDVVTETNLNRQLVALRSTLGKPKVEVMAARIADINPACRVQLHRVFYTPANAAQYPLAGYDYIVDAIDTVSAKIELAVRASQAGVTLISAMGAGNKLHPEQFRVDALRRTSVCPLARVMRRELKKRNLDNIKVVYSVEPPLVPKPVDAGLQAEEGHGGGQNNGQPSFQDEPQRPGTSKNNLPGSISFVPGAAGFVLAGAVVRDLLGI